MNIETFLKEFGQMLNALLYQGGRVCINIANLGRKPYIPLHAFIIEDMLELGFLVRGEIIWNKGTSPSTAWGSWMSAKNPIQLYTFESEVVLDPFMEVDKPHLLQLKLIGFLLATK